MPLSSSNTNAFNSDANGSYDVSFFAYSVRHTVSLSERIFGRMSGTFSSCSETWSNTSREEQRAYLLEYHEIAHHGLLFSTPAGVLLWRLNQVIARDVRYLSQNLEQLGVGVPLDQSPREWLTSAAFLDVLSGHAWACDEHKTYLSGVILALEQVLLFRDIFFGADPQDRHSKLKMYELLELCNAVYSYLADRCRVTFRVNWTTRLPLNTPVFPTESAFNVSAIAECHAVARELSILREMGDLVGFNDRLGNVLQGQFGRCFGHAIQIAKCDNEVGINLNTVQLAALLAFSGVVDTATGAAVETFIEDQLPWWRFSRLNSEMFSRMYVESIPNLLSQQTQPLIDSSSKWLVFSSLEVKDTQDVSAFISTLSSFGLDIQIYLFHQAARRNVEFLVYCQDAKQDYQHLFDEWHKFLHLNNTFVEYKDAFFLSRLDLEQVYGRSSPIRNIPGFSRLEFPYTQLLAHLTNGAIVKRAIAAYCGTAVPNISVVRKKCIRFIDREYRGFVTRGQLNILKKTMGGYIEKIFETGADVPFGVGHLHQLKSEDKFI